MGSPVNPTLGAKVLPDETDFSLPGPMTLSWSRTYSSYISADNKNAAGEDAARVGLLGPGWLELTRFHGHIIVREEGVRNESTCLQGGVCA